MIKFVLRGKHVSQTWTMAAFSTHRFGPGFRAAAFWSKGRNALREKNITIALRKVAQEMISLT